MNGTLIRVGTWNVRVAAEIQDGHRALIENGGCDVWLLTEVNGKWLDSEGKILGLNCLLSKQMDRQNHFWSAILSKHPIESVQAPHDASCVARVGRNIFCSSVLPWSGATSTVWKDGTHSEQMWRVIENLKPTIENAAIIWGGDWNISFVGDQRRGSAGARRVLHRFIRKCKLQVPTAGLMHQDGNYASIDHIALPQQLAVSSVRRVASDLSDHDAYIVDFLQGDGEL